jgi:hypothetical protein
MPLASNLSCRGLKTFSIHYVFYILGTLSAQLHHSLPSCELEAGWNPVPLASTNVSSLAVRTFAVTLGVYTARQDAPSFRRCSKTRDAELFDYVIDAAPELRHRRSPQV